MVRFANIKAIFILILTYKLEKPLYYYFSEDFLELLGKLL